MRMTKTNALRWSLRLAAVLALGACVARGYFVAPPLSLEKLAAEADIIFKGTMVFSGVVRDDGFEPEEGFAVHETRFTVISTIKGETSNTTLRFRHYGRDLRQHGMYKYEPQHYLFEGNRTYIVFARMTGDPGICRQLHWKHTFRMDQGVLLCLDEEPVQGKTAGEALWHELTRLLKDTDASNIAYAIRHLDEMSATKAHFRHTADFDRTEVLTLVRDLIWNPDPVVAQAAITVMGSGNPYLSDENTESWLATIRKDEARGFAERDATLGNGGGERYWKDLESIASTAKHPETRALAIRALGLVREPALRGAVDRWLADPVPVVRAAATVLLADYPGPTANHQLTALADDPDPKVRECAARAIGYAQQKELAPVLGRLLADMDRDVRRVASASLLSLSPENEIVAGVLQASLGNWEFEPLFLKALSRETPMPFRDDLAQMPQDGADPANRGGGKIPNHSRWRILFKYLQTQEALDSGMFDLYLEAMETLGNSSSSNQRDIYAFYILRGMHERAKAFRERANKASNHNLEPYFKQVDENPSRNSL